MFEFICDDDEEIIGYGFEIGFFGRRKPRKKNRKGVGRNVSHKH